MIPEQLIDAYLDGEITPPQMDRLDAWIREDAENARLFTRRAMVHSCIDQQMRSLDADHTPHQVLELRPRSPILGFLGNLSEDINWHTHPARFFTLVAVLTLVTWVGFYFYIRPALWGEREVAERPAEPPMVFVAKLWYAVDAAWGGDESMTPIVSSHLQQGRKLELKSGLAEIHFDSGARVVLEGPVECTLTGENACNLQLGRLAARVPGEAVGFTVHTPMAVIVDRGTAFGVQVEPDGLSDVGVFEGSVEMAVAPTSGGPSVRRVVTSGQSARVTPDAPGELVVRSLASGPQIVRELPRRTLVDSASILNASFEEPDITTRPGYRADVGNLLDEPIVGWGESFRTGGRGAGAFSHYQIVPHDTPQDRVRPAATDGRQVVLVVLKRGASTSAWVYQPLGAVTGEDVGRVLELRADVASRDAPGRDGASATVAFATGVTATSQGVNVGDQLESAVDPAVLQSEGFHTLSDTITIGHDLVGQVLFVRLSVTDPMPTGRSENQYYLDNVQLVRPQ